MDRSNLPCTQQDASATTFKMQAAYRVETALSNRAACQATECKNAGIKIDKHELRLGVWVDYHEHGSWMWRHWGCITGKQLQNIREYMADPEKPGEYLWDKLDGYEGEEHNSLDKSPDLQEKVKLTITQGFIDPDDFNGDPEMNVLGAIGLRSAASKKKMRQEKITGAIEIQELRAQLAAVTAERNELRQIVAQLQIQYGRVNVGMNDTASSMNGLNKKPTAKRSLVDDASGYGEDRKPAKRRATKKVPKEEVDKPDGGLDEAAMIAATKKPRGKRVAKKDTDIIKLEDGIKALPVAPVAPTRKRAARGKKAVKEKAANEGNVIDGGETLKGADISITPSNPVNAGAKVKTEAFVDVPMMTIAECSSLGSLGGSLTTAPAGKGIRATRSRNKVEIN